MKIVVNIKMRRPLTRLSIVALCCAGAIYGQTPSIVNTDVDQMDAGGPSFTNSVNGSGFVAGSVAYWGATPLATTLVTSGQLRVTVPASLIAISGKYPVTVRNPNGAVSNTFSAYVYPVLVSLLPLTTATGGRLLQSSRLASASHPLTFFISSGRLPNSAFPLLM
jgi:hypothetical protein